MTHATERYTQLQDDLRQAIACYDSQVLKLARIQPTAEEWEQALADLCEARAIVLKIERVLAARATQPQPQPQPQPEPTKVEPEPAKVKSVSQEKAEANAKVALANKGKSTKEKAEALDVPVATVRKVEKAKAATKVPVPATDKPMDTAAMKKLAKELGVSYEGIKFTSSKAREQFRATLQQAQANHDAKIWEGLSPSRQAKLSKMQSVDSNRASARAISI